MPYLSASDVISKLALPNTTSVQADVTSVLELVEPQAEQYCEMSFAQEDETVKDFDGSGSPILTLGAYLRVLDTVEVLDADGNVSQTLTDVVPCPNPPRRKDGSGNNIYTWVERRQSSTEKQEFERGLANIRLTGDWGFVTLPKPIKSAIIFGVANYFNVRMRDESIKETTSIGLISEYFDPEKFSYLPIISQKLLNNWRHMSALD